MGRATAVLATGTTGAVVEGAVAADNDCDLVDTAVTLMDSRRSDVEDALATRVLLPAPNIFFLLLDPSFGVPPNDAGKD